MAALGALHWIRLGQRLGRSGRRCPLTGELIGARSNGDAARMNAFAVESHTVRVIVGDVHVSLTAGGNSNREGEVITLGFPAGLVGAKLRVVVGFGETDAAARLWGNQGSPEARLIWMVADADHDAHHPITHAAIRKVIERVHDGSLQPKFVVPRIPAFPHGGGTLGDRVEPRRE